MIVRSITDWRRRVLYFSYSIFWFFTVLGDQESFTEDHCQAFKAESFHESCELQPHYAHQVFVLINLIPETLGHTS